jgi:Amt family ammonium transporter
MTPGLAYFYGGMVNAKNVISTMLQSFIAMGVISIVWVVEVTALLSVRV